MVASMRTWSASRKEMMSRVATADPLWTMQSTLFLCARWSWYDGLSHAPVWTNMDAYQVIRHPGDEVEGARWACRVRRQQGPVEIASGPIPAVLRLGRTWLPASSGGEVFLFLPWLAQLVDLPNGRVAVDRSPGRTDDWRVVCDFKLEPTAHEV